MELGDPVVAVIYRSELNVRYDAGQHLANLERFVIGVCNFVIQKIL